MGQRDERLAAALSVAFAAQLAGVAALAGLAPVFAIGAASAGALLARATAPRLLRRAPAATAMLALGGLGMTLGWWADLGFESALSVAAHARAPLDPLWCRAPAGPAAWAGLPGLGHVVSWMNAGMLLFGVPAARLACRDPEPGTPAPWRCALAMVAGMALGSRLAAALAPDLGPSTAVVLDYSAMLLGMGAGMATAEGLSPGAYACPAWEGRIGRPAATGSRRR